MGSVLNGVGSIVGSIGGGVAEGAGATDQYKTSNPYSDQQFQQYLAQQNQIYGNQQSLAQALQAQMNGQGPNPAQTQFMGNVQNNIANAQGLIASQRGLNPALAARMGANQASQANQQAALGSALLQQQQQLAATQNLGNLYGQMQQGNLGAQQLYTGANATQQGINSGVEAQNAQIRGQIAGGLLGAGGAIGAGAAKGGGGGAAAGGGGAAVAAAHGAIIPGKAKVDGDSRLNDTVDAKLSPGEIVIPRSMAHDPEKAKAFIDHLLQNEKGSEVGYGDVLKARRKKAKK